MKKKTEKLAKLMQIQTLSYNKDFMQYQQAQSTVSDIELEILELRKKLKDRPDDLGLETGDLPYWNTHSKWIEQRIKFLNQNLATARAILEQRRHQLSQSNGRRLALDKLISK